MDKKLFNERINRIIKAFIKKDNKLYKLRRLVYLTLTEKEISYLNKDNKRLLLENGINKYILKIE